MSSLPWTSLNPVVRTLDVRRRDDTDDAAICLPSDLLAATPECAISCIHDFTHTNYQEYACPFTSSLTYLCTSTTSSGLTIGEGAIQCLVSRCSGTDLTRTAVYNICDTVPGAIAKTASVITATIQPAKTASTMAAPLPATISNPMVTQAVTSIVMASGIPSIAVPTAAPPIPSDTNDIGSSSTQTVQSSPSTTSSGSNSTASAVAVADKGSPKSALSTSAIAGIGIGAAFATLLILALIFWRCRRREKLQRRRSMRWSMHGARTPPPDYGSPPVLPAIVKMPEESFLSPAASNQRFYSTALVEEKRRSFWRRSIKPEDIGVAVSPHVIEESSPASFSSQQSMTKLLPKIPEKLPTRASTGLWPAPLSLQTERRRKSLTNRPASDATIFDEDLEANSTFHPPRLSEARHSVSMSHPSEKRERTYPAPLQLNPVHSHAFPSSSKGKEQSPADRIPLTPTYDNGNVVQSLPRNYPPSSWRQTGKVDDMVAPPPLSALPEEMSPSRHVQPHTNVLREKVPPRVATKAARSEPTLISSDPKPPPHRKDSTTTLATDIEEDTTPEEIEKQMEMVEKRKPAAILISSSDDVFDGPRSPISNLKYPPVPRSAGLSRHAESTPQRQRKLEVPLTPTRPGPSRPSRDQLIRNEASFMVTETTSSDGHLSERSIEWPVPPPPPPPPPRSARDSLKSSMSKLRENPSSANRGSSKAFSPHSMNQVRKFGPRSSSRILPSGPTSKAKHSPGTTQNGDLFFKVEI